MVGGNATQQYKEEGRFNFHLCRRLTENSETNSQGKEKKRMCWNIQPSIRKFQTTYEILYSASQRALLSVICG
jgi:hypothetical protein